MSNLLPKKLAQFTALFLLLLGSFFVLIMLNIALPYLLPPFPTDIDFLANKEDYLTQDAFYMSAFYTHITSSCLVLAFGLPLFWPYFLQNFPLWHRRLGRYYSYLLLFLAAPSGLIMAFSGSGGTWAKVAFVCQALLWWALTAQAFRLALAKNFRGHAAFMIRSYAFSLSAISLRLFSYLISYLRYQYDIPCPSESFPYLCFPQIYVFEAWGSWIFNALIAEILIAKGLIRLYLGPKFN